MASGSPPRNTVESSFVDVEAWTENTLQAVARLRVTASPEAVRRGVSLSIPLDADPIDGRNEIEKSIAVRRDGEELLRPEPRRRDSMKRREALLKGKEGSRRRQKWENDNLLGNPHVQPPLPYDWEVRPTHPVHTVPYALASLWDARKAEEDRKARKSSKKSKPETQDVGRVPKELKEKLKRSRAAKGLLQDLEEEVRQFVQTVKEAETNNTKKEETAPGDESDDGFVLVTNTPLHSRNSSLDFVQIYHWEKLIYSSGLDEDASARFVRFLVHSLGRYYDLDTWSVTVGEPARKDAYIGIKDSKTGNRPALSILPRPLYAMV